MTAKVKLVGRPRPPPPPSRAEPYERPEYVARVDAVITALEIGGITKEARLYLQRTLSRCDMGRSINPGLAAPTGEERITPLLRAIFKSSNGGRALTLPILDAVSNCLRPVWIQTGLKFIEAFDDIDLVGLHRTLTELGLADQLGARHLRKKLERVLGPPTAIAPVAKPVKVKAPKKLPARASLSGCPDRKADRAGLKAARTEGEGAAQQ